MKAYARFDEISTVGYFINGISRLRKRGSPLMPSIQVVQKWHFRLRIALFATLAPNISTA